MSDYRASKPPRKRRQKWETVDWVELGCRGWSIDESGAELEGPNDSWFAHLDWTTLEVMLNGDGAWVYRVMGDLTAAGVLNWFPQQTWSIAPNTGTTTTTTAVDAWIANPQHGM